MKRKNNDLVICDHAAICPIPEIKCAHRSTHKHIGAECSDNECYVMKNKCFSITVKCLCANASPSGKVEHVGRALLSDAFHTLKHDRLFLTTSEKINSTGIKLHDELVQRIADYLNASNKNPHNNGWKGEG
jgi:hypothetical protein